jgi:hypothetical protein
LVSFWGDFSRLGKKLGSCGRELKMMPLSSGFQSRVPGPAAAAPQHPSQISSVLHIVVGEQMILTQSEILKPTVFST